MEKTKYSFVSDGNGTLEIICEHGVANTIYSPDDKINKCPNGCSYNPDLLKAVNKYLIDDLIETKKQYKNAKDNLDGFLKMECD